MQTWRWLSLPPMRKFVALMLSLMIVLLSSMPMVPLASACAPAHDAAMHGMDDGIDMQAHHAAMQAADTQTVASDVLASNVKAEAGQACIECGCGCHDSIDSLPHMLAPHSPDTASLSCVQGMQRVDPLAELNPEPRVLSVFSPPPQFI